MNGKKEPYWVLGVVVLLVLAVLTGLEFFVAINFQSAIVILFIIALFKAVPILQNFMHMSTLWSEEDEH
jgi:heme/copper-type cytochrome/quinol oxidase subunit 4